MGAEKWLDGGQKVELPLPFLIQFLPFSWKKSLLGTPQRQIGLLTRSERVLYEQ